MGSGEAKRRRDRFRPLWPAASTHVWVLPLPVCPYAKIVAL